MLSPFATTLTEYFNAGYPALAIDTHEEDRLLSELRALSERQWDYLVWSATRGWVDRDNRPVPQLGGAHDPVAALGAVRDQLIPQRTIAVFLDLHPWFAVTPDLTRAVRDALGSAKATNRPMLFCSPGWRPPLDLQKDVVLLDYPLPTREQFRALVHELLDANRQRAEAARRLGQRVEAPLTLPDDVMAAVLDAARGLTWNEAENAIALALIRHGDAPARLVDTIQREKTLAVRRQGVLQLIEPTETLDAVGGLDPLKAWLASQSYLLRHVEQALAWGFRADDLPKGMLLIGIPGTGKSLIARAVASAWGLPLLRMDMAGLLGSLVGQSETQTRQALLLAEAMAPAVLHIDEIEKALAGAQGAHDSGVMAHILGMMLTWLQERNLSPSGGHAPVFVVATANRIDLLPPEIYRPGRFDRTWFLDLGSAAERLDVLRIHVAKRRQRVDPQFLAELASDEHTRQFSPAELELLVKQACLAAFSEARALEPRDLLAAAHRITPYALSHEEHLRGLREFAQRWAEPANRAPATSDTRTLRRTLTS
jgi:ATP-dependent 26S proteasome regulatory subunit